MYLFVLLQNTLCGKYFHLLLCYRSITIYLMFLIFTNILQVLSILRIAKSVAYAHGSRPSNVKT